MGQSTGMSVVSIRLTAVLAIVLGSACGSLRQPLAAPEAATVDWAVPAPDSRAGHVGVEFLADSSAPPPRLAEHEELYRPEPRFMPTPRYPEAALAAGAGPVSVEVRIWVGEQGTVERVAPGRRTTFPTGSIGAEFDAAVDEAVRRWQFSPGRIDTVEDGQDLDGDGKPDYTVLIRTRPATVYYDLRFDFRIVDGQGQVEVAGDEKAPSPASGKGA